MNTKEIISIRKSVRTYENEPISDDLRQMLETYISRVDAPFDTKMRFILVDTKNDESQMKLATYGVIKGAGTFICSAVEESRRTEENLGYAFEKIVLYATSLNLGTCWLGGSFNRSEFAKAAGIRKNEIIPIVSPVGYSKEGRSFIDTVIAAAAGSKNRKDRSELFFDKDMNTPLDPDEAGPFLDALEMVRIAPSASNKQPWRIVKDGNTFHFYLCRTFGYREAVSFDLQRLDIGIAMCHFELMANEQGLTGRWIDHTPGLAVNKDAEYIISYAAGR